MSQTQAPISQSFNPADAKFAHAFLSTQICLIVEPSSAFSTSIRACLQELGVPSSNILIASKFAQAKQLLLERRPTVLITEYKIESSSGFELIELQESMHEEGKRISFITSKSTSTSVIAEAAEGQVDGYLLKPFSVVDFRKYFVDIIRRKVEPSPYLSKLILSRQHAAVGDFSLASKELVEAKKLHPKPALACFRMGEVYRTQGDFVNAIAQYREGRSHVALHFKCVIAEYETLVQMSKFDEALVLVPTIRAHFPMSSPRLTQLFQTAHAARAYDELHPLFDLYRELDERSSELLVTAENVFFDAGKASLALQDKAKATTFFDTGLQIAGRGLDFVERVIGEFLSVNASKEADAFLSKALPGDIGTPAYHRLSFRVNQQTMTTDQLLNKGRELVFAGHGTPEIFLIVVKSFAQAGKETMAESTIGKAVETFPELRTTLYKVLEEHLPKQAS